MKYIIYSQLTMAQLQDLIKRPCTGTQETVAQQVAAVEQKVISDGYAALQSLSFQWDKVHLEPEQFALKQPIWRKAWDSLSPDFQEALQTARHNIAKFHQSELPQRTELPVETTTGVHCWREFRAIESVGLYIPGGSAPLFSTMLMLGIPAIIAGCRQIVFCSPPVSLERGAPYAPQEGIYAPQEMLACMELLYQFSCQLNAKLAIHDSKRKIGTVPDLQYFQVGGAQAIFAMAYGCPATYFPTQTYGESLYRIPKVAKIFGPGNTYIAEAKRKISHQVAIDMLAGPSEVLIIADKENTPTDIKIIAADLLAQAEHGPDSQVILVSPNAAMLRQVETEITRQAALLPRAQTIEQTLSNSYLIETNCLNEALEFSNLYAPEHLILAMEDYHALLPQIVNAGSVFCGRNASESFGDYASGPNHTLPTSGFSRSGSGVHTGSFGRWLTFQSVTAEGLRKLGPTVELLATQELLHAHKNAVTMRLKQLD